MEGTGKAKFCDSISDMVVEMFFPEYGCQDFPHGANLGFVGSLSFLLMKQVDIHLNKKL